MDYQYDRNISPVSMKSYYNAIKHFYESNEIQLNWLLIKKDYVGLTSSLKVNVDMPYSYEEIHRMLDKADERMRVVILLLASTGMRRGAVHDLKVGDLNWIDQYKIYEITVYWGFKDEYKAFCSFECASEVNSYLDFRRRYGEQITPESYLIRKQFNRRDGGKGTMKISDVNDSPQKHKVTDDDIEAGLYRLIYDSGIRSFEDRKTRKGDRHKNMAAHSYRKFFENKCLESGIDPFYVSVLMGHKSGIGIEKHYYRPASINGEYSLLELYVKKAMPYLTISEESRLRLKNRELEIRMQEDERRFKQALEQTQSMNHDSMIALSEQLLKMQKEIEELKKKEKK